MAIQHFEDLEIWKEARSITREVYQLSKSGYLSKDYSLRDQMRRAAVSIMANIAEGFERGGNQEFIQFLYVAKASCGELRSELYVAVDQEYIEEKTANSLATALKRLSIMIKHLIDHLRRSTIRGPKYDNSTAPSPSKAHQPNGKS
jgi:four helix bundle protein